MTNNSKGCLSDLAQMFLSRYFPELNLASQEELSGFCESVLCGKVVL